MLDTRTRSRLGRPPQTVADRRSAVPRTGEETAPSTTARTRPRRATGRRQRADLAWPSQRDRRETVRSPAGQETHWPRGESAAARDDACSSTREQPFGFIPVLGRIDAERIARIDEQRPTVFAVDAAGLFDGRASEGVHRTVACPCGTRILPARDARAIWKKWLQAPSFDPHHIVRRQVTRNFDDGDDRIGTGITQHGDGMTDVIRSP